MFTCETCNMSFPNKTNLTSHRPSHYKFGFHCPVGCGRNYTSAKRLNNHLEKVHVGAEILIPAKQGELNLKVETEPEVHFCPECAKCFDSIKKLSKHVDEFHSETEKYIKLYKCMDCLMAFKEFDNFVNHCVKHTKNSAYVEIDKDAATIYQCKECTKVYNSHDECLDHLIREHIETKCEPLEDNGYSEQEQNDEQLEENMEKLHNSESSFSEDAVVKREIEDNISGTEDNIGIQKEFEQSAQKNAEGYGDVEYLDEEFLSEDADDAEESDYGEVEYLESDDSDVNSEMVWGYLVQEEDRRSGRLLDDPANTSNRTLYRCKICSNTYKAKVDLLEHMKTHSCEICNKIFKTKNYLAAHNKRVHSGPKQECFKCGKVFRKRGVLRRHTCDVKKLQDSITCEKCEEVFLDKKTYMEHMKTHPALEDYKCSLCEKIFSRAFFLQLHMRRHKRDSIFVCPTCSKNYKMKKDYLEHVKKCGIIPAFVCGICGFSGFKEESSYLVHLKRHRGEDCYACELCGTPFKLKRDLKAHVLTHIEKLDFESESGEEEEEEEEWLEEYLSEGLSSD